MFIVMFIVAPKVEPFGRRVVEQGNGTVHAATPARTSDVPVLAAATEDFFEEHLE
jgi:hypothetical protein